MQPEMTGIIQASGGGPNRAYVKAITCKSSLSKHCVN